VEPYDWMVQDTPQEEWIRRRGSLLWLAFFFIELGAGIFFMSSIFGSSLSMLIGWLVCAIFGGRLSSGIPWPSFALLADGVFRRAGRRPGFRAGWFLSACS